MPKLSHTKTRKGCLRCKARKVKYIKCGDCPRLWPPNRSEKINSCLEEYKPEHFIFFEAFMTQGTLENYRRALSSLLNFPRAIPVAGCVSDSTLTPRTRGSANLVVAIKCDETHPECGACLRHNVPCQYGENMVHLDPSSARGRRSPQPHGSYISRRRSPLPQASSSSHGPSSLATGSDAQQHASMENSTATVLTPPVAESSVRLLELRLMHQFTAFTSLSFSPAGKDLWHEIAPDFSLSYEFLLDTIFAVAALHLSRLHPKDSDVLKAARRYFNKSLEGQSRALPNVHGQRMAEALYINSVLINFHAFVLAGTGDEDTSGESLEVFRWLRICSGTRIVYETCRPHFAPRSQVFDAIFLSPPNLADNDVIFAPANVGIMAPLLEWGTDFESISDADQDAYDKVARYVGLIYQKVEEGEEAPLASYRRVLNMPGRCPAHFLDLVDERRPRALAILAYLFAALKVIKGDAWWITGIAERQVRIIRDLLPNGWRTMIEFPLRLVSE